MFKVAGISKNYRELRVFNNLSLEFPVGKITTMLGPSGCGKTTILNILAGLIKPDKGSVTISGQVSYIFQDPRLLPWLTVRENIGLVLPDDMKPDQKAERLLYYLNATGLQNYGDFYPSQLSGGLRQRVALARAFCYEAPVLLMDEPFKSLDIKTRYRLIEDFIALWRAIPRTVVAVTHDVQEAVLLGDRIIGLTDKPTTVQKIWNISIPQEERRLNPEIHQLEVAVLQEMLR